jgi:histidine triad (HIT) family protein
MSCLFCSIIEGEIPAKKVYEDDSVLAFHDITPAAPVHVLVVPKKHIEKLTDLTDEDSGVMGHILTLMPRLLSELGLEGRGVRVVNNCLEEAGQSVFHIHFHILGGRAFSWPPG